MMDDRSSFNSICAVKQNKITDGREIWKCGGIKAQLAWNLCQYFPGFGYDTVKILILGWNASDRETAKTGCFFSEFCENPNVCKFILDNFFILLKVILKPFGRFGKILDYANLPVCAISDVPYVNIKNSSFLNRFICRTYLYFTGWTFSMVSSYSISEYLSIAVLYN